MLYGMALACGWRRWHPDVERIYEHFEQAVAYSQQRVVLQLGDW